MSYPDRTVVHQQPDISEHTGSVLGENRVSEVTGGQAAVGLGNEGASPEVAPDQARLLIVLRKPVPFVPQGYNINRPKIFLKVVKNEAVLAKMKGRDKRKKKNNALKSKLTYQCF